MRRGCWTSDIFSLTVTMRRYATMTYVRLLVLVGVVTVASAYPAAPYWMNGGRHMFAIPASMAMPPVPHQFFPNRALSFSGYFTGSGSPYQGQWASTRQDVPYYMSEDGSMQVSAMMGDGYGSSHGYNQVDTPVSMDGSGLLFSGGGGAASSGSGRVDNSASPQYPPEISTTTAYPEPEVNTVAGSSEEPTPTPTAEPEPTTTTTVAPQPPPPPPPSPPVAPAASEPAGASAPPPPPPPHPQPPKRRNGGRSNQPPHHQPPQHQPQDNDNDNYGNPTINAWFPFVFGGSGGGNPNRAYNADDDSHLTPNSYNPRPQYGRSTGSAGHSPVAIANSFSTGRNAMAHSVATAYGAPRPDMSSQQRN